MPTPAPNTPKAESVAATPQTELSQSVTTLKTADAITVTGKGKYKVAPGRTLLHAEIVENDGIKATRNKPLSPGDEIELETAEAEQLIKLGFLLDTDGSIVVRADGPAVNVDNGVQIAQPA